MKLSYLLPTLVLTAGITSADTANINKPWSITNFSRYCKSLDEREVVFYFVINAFGRKYPCSITSQVEENENIWSQSWQNKKCKEVYLPLPSLVSPFQMRNQAR